MSIRSKDHSHATCLNTSEVGSKPFGLRRYLEEKRKGTNMIVLLQRFQINLTREVEWCRKIGKDNVMLNKENLNELWEKMELFCVTDEKTVNNSNSLSPTDSINSSPNIRSDSCENEFGDNEDDLKELSKRLTVFASHFKGSDSPKCPYDSPKFIDGANSTNEGIGLDMFYIENELNLMRTFPIYVCDSKILKMYDTSDVLIENGVIIKGKLRGIVNVGVIHKNKEVLQTLIWTNGLYSSNSELLKYMTDCFEVSCLGDSVECQIARSRLIASLKYWVESCLFDDNFLKEIRIFIERLRSYGMNNASNNLNLNLSRRLEGMGTIFSRNDSFDIQILIPPSLYFDEEISIEMMSPIEVARQFTLMGFSLFSKIKLNELLLWNEQNKETHCKSILATTQFSNKVVDFFVSIILSQKRLKRRVELFEFICAIGIEAEQLHNYDLLCCLSFIFNKSPIYRLKRTFGSLSDNSQQFLTRLKKLSSPDNNRSELRNAISKDVNVVHALPYLGIFLSDITFINDGNKSTLGNKIINYLKCNMLTDVARKIYRLQQIPYYDLVESVPMQRFLLRALDNAVSTSEYQSDQEQYVLSKKIEPSVKQCVFPVKESKFLFMPPTSNKPKPYYDDPKINVETFLSSLFPTLTPYVSFVAVSQNTFIGFPHDTPLNLLIPATYYTVYLKPTEVTAFILTEDGWLKTKVLLDASRPLFNQINSFFAILVEKYPFVLMHMKNNCDENTFLDMNASLYQNEYNANDYIVVYPLKKLRTHSFGYKADIILFDDEKNYYAASLSMVSSIIVERGVDGALKEVGVNVTLIVAGMFMYVYQKDNLIRIFPIQQTKARIYPGTRGVVLILSLNIDVGNTSLTETISLIGDNKSIFDIMERVDVLTYQFSKCFMGISLKITLARENRKMPYVIEKLISSISLDQNFLKSDTFDFIDFSIAVFAHSIDGHSHYDFNQLPIQKRISLLRCFLGSLPDPLIPPPLYDDFMRVSKFPEMEHCDFINKQLAFIGVSSSLLSSLIYLLHLYLTVNPSKFDKLLPFLPIIFRNGDVVSPFEKITFKILIQNTPRLKLPITQIQPIQFISSLYLLKIKMPDFPAMNQLIEDLMNTSKQQCVEKKHNPSFCKIKPPPQSTNETDMDKLLYPSLSRDPLDDSTKETSGVIDMETFLCETKKEKTSKRSGWLAHSSSRSMTNSPVSNLERPTKFLGSTRKLNPNKIPPKEILISSNPDSPLLTPKSSRSSQEEIVCLSPKTGKKSPRPKRGAVMMTANGWTTAEIQTPRHSSFLLETENQ